MSTNEEPRAPLDERIPSNAVSVYGQTDAMDDFPVLKAFQQYIDAEQTKSRKRMMMLCIFFGCLMTVVIAVFIVMLHSVSERNQSLNDRFLEYMMQERNHTQAQQPVASPAPAANPATDAALKAMTESISSLQKELAEQKTAAATKETEAKTAAKSAHEQELEALAAKRELLEAERKKIAEEKELLHQQEVERQRRRLYPEYYQDNKAPATTTSPSRGKSTAPKTRVTQDDISQQDIDEILSEAYGDDSEEEVTEAPPPKKTTKKTAAAKKTTSTKSSKTPDAKSTSKKNASGKDTVESDDDAIEYFNDDEYSIPVEVKGSSAGWKVPLS